jgi:hypothetical protein
VLDIQIDSADGYTICRPVGELDAFTVSQFRQALAQLASNERLLIWALSSAASGGHASSGATWLSAAAAPR